MWVLSLVTLLPGVGRSGRHTAGSSHRFELAHYILTHRSLSKKSSFTSVYLRTHKKHTSPITFKPDLIQEIWEETKLLHLFLII